MREKRASVVVFETHDLTQEQFDQPIFWLLAAMLAFMPMALGSWDPWAEALALGGACALAVMLGVKLIGRADVPFIWSWTYLPISLFFGVVLLQLLPLPAGLVGAISPKTVATNKALLGDLPEAAQRLEHIRFTFYQEGTWHDLRNLVAVTCVFVVVVNVFRTADQMIQLLWVIAWVGTAQAVLAILQILTNARGVYWLFPLWGSARPEAGSFTNHNCFSQFMNLSSGAMVGLLLLKIDQTFHRRDYDPPEVMEKLTSADFRWAYVLVAMLAVSLASVFLSLSRGGMLSIAAAGALVAILLAVRGGARGMGIGGWVAGVILVAVFSLVMASGANLVEGRIAKIGNLDDRYDRFQLTKDSLRAWHDYPALGMGLGSFRYTFPRYDRSDAPAIASHAEDDYAQLLEETGVAGASIAGCFLLMIVGAFLRARARSRKNREREREDDSDEGPDPIAEQALAPSPGKETEMPALERSTQGGGYRRQRSGGSHHPHHHRHAASPASSLSLGLCFGLVAILVQSAMDFGQHCVSIACLTAIFCALMVNLSSLRRRERGLESEGTAKRGVPAVRGAAVALIALGSILLLWQANQVREAKADYDIEARLAEQLSMQQWRGDPGDVTDMNRAADAAAALRPNDMRYQFRRAMNRFYAMTANTPLDPVTEDFILDDQKRAIVRDLADDLRKARWVCPTYGELYAQMGQWERSFLGRRDEGANHIRIAFELDPGDVTVCQAIATLDGEEGKWDESVQMFQRAVKMAPGALGDSIDLYVGYFHRPDIGLKFADDDIDRLHMLSQKLRSLGKDPALGPTTGPATQPSDEAVAIEADRRADKLIRAAADSPDASADTIGQMGMLCSQNRETADAIKYLSRALTLAYGDVGWRMEYARNLAAAGRKDDAIEQAETVLRIRPHFEPAQDLIEHLSTPSTRAMEELSQ
jgi:O-antigen ligase/tetratricopeptide (TPR) repeat protein